jgi:radical SAM protein with 4Fe4S-binding SPASM domain
MSAAICVSDDQVYGNIHDMGGLERCWKNMQGWRTKCMIPPECQDCHLLEECHAGCRMVALHCTGQINGCDNLRNGFDYRQEDGFRIVRNKSNGAKVEFVND